MLAALLTNIPHGQSGQLFGSVGPTGTGWNKHWAKEYGPDVDKAKKVQRQEVKAAVKAIKAAPVSEPLEDAKDIVGRSLVSELMQDEESLVAVLTAYYALKRWKKRQNDTAIALLLS